MIKSLMHYKYRNIVFTIIGIALVFILWWIISSSIPNGLFPTPVNTFIRFGELFTKVSLYEAIGGSLLRLLISLSICLIISLILGILAGLFDPIYRILKPLVIVLRTLPVAAVIFALVVFLKPFYSLFIITNLMMFPLMYEAIASSVRNIDQGVMESIRLDSSRIRPMVVTKIIIPCAGEGILLGVIQSLGLGMKVSLMAETLVGSNAISGLGRLLYRYYVDLEMDYVFAIALYAIILIGLLDLSLALIKRKMNK